MNTADHDDDPTVENDPTGVRALLSSLPDPGPMPDAVFDRINASLQQEQERRQQQAAFGHDPSPGVISLAAERHRRRPMRTLTYLGAAAGLAVAATVVSTQLFGPGSGNSADVSAQVGSKQAEQDAPAAADSDAADDAAGADAGGFEEAEEGAAAETGDDGSTADEDFGSSAMGLTLLESPEEATLASSDFPGEVAQWHDEHATSVTSQSAADAEGRGLASCADLLGSQLPQGAEVLLVPATLDGEPAVLALQTEPTPRTAWALDPACADGAGEILQGPSILP